MKSISVKLKPGLDKKHHQANRNYMLSLDPSRLLANFYIQAGPNSNIHDLPKHYGCWEEPDQQVRGNFTGHSNSSYERRILFENEKGPVLAQYIPFEAKFSFKNQKINMEVGINSEYPEYKCEFVLKVKCGKKAEFTLTVRSSA